jgi:uncharacterized protein YegL
MTQETLKPGVRIRVNRLAKLRGAVGDALDALRRKNAALHDVMTGTGEYRAFLGAGALLSALAGGGRTGLAGAVAEISASHGDEYGLTPKSDPDDAVYDLCVGFSGAMDRFRAQLAGMSGGEGDGPAPAGKKLAVYILIDTSGSMSGEPIEAVKAGLGSLFSALNRDSQALESVHLCVITFDREARILMPLRGIANLGLPAIADPRSSPTNLGEALRLMCRLRDAEVRKPSADDEGDWLPMCVVMTDGSPSDTALFGEMCDLLAANRHPFSRIIGCAAGPKAKTEPLKRFATDVVSLETMDTNGFSKFWQWVSQSFAEHSQNGELTLDDLPPPPAELRIAF